MQPEISLEETLITVPNMCVHRHTWRSWESNLQEEFFRRMLPCSPVWQMSLKRRKFLRIWPSLWNDITKIFWLKFAVSLVAGVELLEVPGSPSSFPSPYHTSTLWQEQGSYNTCQRQTCRSHLTNIIWNIDSVQNIFFSQTWYDLNRRGGTRAQEVKEQCCLEIWELR